MGRRRRLRARSGHALPIKRGLVHRSTEDRFGRIILVLVALPWNDPGKQAERLTDRLDVVHREVVCREGCHHIVA